MKERLEAKIEEVLNLILEKDAEDINPMEYGILDAALKEIRMKEAQEESNRKLALTMAEVLGSSFRG
ncbi:MAG: hypothetical protein J6P40_04385 [Oscillospiraceae bacterium]|nr:hypothetical protein [Oscillospiraceae bacterium]